MLVQALSEIAQVDKVRYTGPPPRVAKNPTAPGARNPVVVPAFTFLPKKYPAGQKLPLIVFALKGISQHYRRVGAELAVPAGWRPPRNRHTVIVFVADVDCSVLNALAYARLAYLQARAYWYNIDPSPQVIDSAQAAADLPQVWWR